jgi:hypothetical protein
MSKTFLPRTDAGLLAWSSNIVARMATDSSVHGVPTAQYTAYAALHATYAAAYTEAYEPQTRTKGAVQAKKDAARLLRRAAKQLAYVVYGYPQITNQQLEDLALTVHDIEPTPQPVPEHAPAVKLISVNGRLVTAQLSDSQTESRRGRPPFTAGALIYSHVGDELPADMTGWRQEGITGKTRIEVLFPLTVQPGSKVWITAQWFNNRKETGPACTPIFATIGFSNVQQAA